MDIEYFPDNVLCVVKEALSSDIADDYDYYCTLPTADMKRTHIITAYDEVLDVLSFIMIKCDNYFACYLFNRIKQHYNRVEETGTDIFAEAILAFSATTSKTDDGLTLTTTKGHNIKNIELVAGEPSLYVLSEKDVEEINNHIRLCVDMQEI